MSLFPIGLIQPKILTSCKHQKVFFLFFSFISKHRILQVNQKLYKERVFLYIFFVAKKKYLIFAKEWACTALIREQQPSAEAPIKTLW